MINTKLGEFCANNPDWEIVLSEKPYSLKIKRDSGFVIFNYDQISSDFNDDIVQEARGIVFREDYWEYPVCHAFNKFGNYGESYVPDIRWSSAFVSEKIDGSLIKVWYSNGWHISTNSTIDAFKAPINDVKVNNFGNYFELALSKYYDNLEAFFNILDIDYTYMFELVGPQNRVVIPYTEPDLYFIGIRNNVTNEEFPCSSLVAGAFGLGKFKLPKTYSLSSIDACIKAAEKLSWDAEGFVVVDAEANRCKIKSPAYVLAHFMRNNNVITKKHLINIILLNEIDEFVCYAADYADELYEVKAIMDFYKDLGNLFISICKQYRVLPRAKYAEIVKAFPKLYVDMLFVAYDRDITAEDYTGKWTKNKWYENFEIIQSFKADWFK